MADTLLLKDDIKDINDLHGLSIEYGEVLHSCSGTYDVIVKATEDDSCVTCIYTAAVFSNWAGVVDCSLPGPGVKVAFIRSKSKEDRGAIVATFPSASSSGDTENLNFSSRPFVQSGGKSSLTEDSQFPSLQYTEKREESRIFASDSRPLDVFPGDWVMANRITSATLALTAMMAQFKATDRAKIEAFVMDDMVRMVSGTYQHIGPMGTSQIYNDGGYLSMEFRGTPHQEELYGSDEYLDNGIGEDIERDLSSEWEKTGSKVTDKDNKPADIQERIQFFLGDLGNIAHLIICNPVPPKKGEYKPAGAKAVHAGLLRLLAAKDGSFNITHSQDLILAKSDHIPVPVKLKEPWDPSGNKSDSLYSDSKDANMPFTISDSNYWGWNLHMRDLFAWKNKQWLAPFDARDKDWLMPEEAATPMSPDKFDRVSDDERDYTKKQHRNKQSFIGQLRDGSIILRDAWGSEIHMRGGNITISCPGEIHYRSGRSQITTSGHDICNTALNSIDNIAVNGDNRIFAKGNMQLTSAAKGVLIESGSSYEVNKDDFNFKKVKGQKVKSGGIILKSATDRIFINARVVHIAASFKIFLETVMANILKGKDLIPDMGEIVISTSNFIHKCFSYSLNVAHGKSGLDIGTKEGSKDILMRAPNVSIYTEEHSGFQLYTGLKGALDKTAGTVVKFAKIMLETLKGRDLASISSSYKVLTDGKKKEYNDYNKTEWMERVPYFTYDIEHPLGGLSQRPIMSFTFRTSKQYCTDKPGEFECTPTDDYEKDKLDSLSFKYYQSSWEYLFKSKKDKRFGEAAMPVMNGSTVWPGYSSGDKQPKVALELEKEVNIADNNITSDSRKKLKSESSILKERTMYIPFITYDKIEDNN